MSDIRQVLGFGSFETEASSCFFRRYSHQLETTWHQGDFLREQRATFEETLHTVHIIWRDETAYASFGTGGKTTKKQVYKELFGKKARKRYAQLYPYLTKKEINEIVKIHAEHVKTATIVMHAASLLHGELGRANLEARRLTQSLTA